MIKEAFLICALALPSAVIKGPKQEAAFFRLFRELAKEGPIILDTRELSPLQYKRLGGVLFRKKYYHVYRKAA